MKIEIISTGEELLSGAVTDTNSACIAQLFEEKNCKVIRHTTIGDDFSTLVALFKEAGERSDLVVVSGGLGPTSDDRTAEAAAKASGCLLKQNKEAFRCVERYFEKFGRPMSESDKKQTLLPEIADCIDNPSGTAPGFSLKIGGGRFFFLPGVPGEMKIMLKKSVLPSVDTFLGYETGKIIKKSFFVFGLPEAIVNQRLEKMSEIFPDVTTGFRADFPVIEIKLKFNRKNEADQGAEDFGQEIEEALAWVKNQIGDYIFSDSNARIEFELGKLLSEKNKTLAVAESCTGGLIGHKLTGVAGSSDYFLSSCVTYADQSKIDILGVPPEILETYGAVSSQTVMAMAEGVRKISGADYGIATSGIAGPGGGSDEKPVGTVFIGLSGEKETKSFKFKSPFGNRAQNKIIFYVKTLDLLRRMIISV